MLGPIKRTNRLLAKILGKYPETKLTSRKIYEPVGLDLGAETPEGIAVSIAVELVNVHRNGSSPHLRDNAYSTIGTLETV